MLVFGSPAAAQAEKQVTRIARVTIDSSKLNEYYALLREQMETAVKVEPGVISYQVYADRNDRARLTIIEVYASDSAYFLHREAPHFKKYTMAVTDMVRSLELTEVRPVLTAIKASSTRR